MTEKTTSRTLPAPLPAEMGAAAEDNTIRPFRIDVPEEAARRPPPTHRGDAVAQQGARRRPVAGRAAGDAAGSSRATGRPTTTGARPRRS